MWGIVVGIASATLIPVQANGYEDLARGAIGYLFGLAGLAIAYGVLAPVLLRKVLPRGRRALPIACALLGPLVLGPVGYLLAFDVVGMGVLLLLWLVLTPVLVVAVGSRNQREQREGAG